jgi:hypothetical protein
MMDFSTAVEDPVGTAGGRAMVKIETGPGECVRMRVFTSMGANVDWSLAGASILVAALRAAIEHSRKGGGL